MILTPEKAFRGRWNLVITPNTEQNYFVAHPFSIMSKYTKIVCEDLPESDMNAIIEGKDPETIGRYIGRIADRPGYFIVIATPDKRASFTDPSEQSWHSTAESTVAQEVSPFDLTTTLPELTAPLEVVTHLGNITLPPQHEMTTVQVMSQLL